MDEIVSLMKALFLRSLNTPQNLSIEGLRRKIRTAKIPYGENSIRRKFRTAKIPYGENSVRREFLRRKIRTAKNPYGEKSYGENSYGENSYGEYSGHRDQDPRIVAWIFSTYIEM